MLSPKRAPDQIRYRCRNNSKVIFYSYYYRIIKNIRRRVKDSIVRDENSVKFSKEKFQIANLQPAKFGSLEKFNGILTPAAGFWLWGLSLPYCCPATTLLPYYCPTALLPYCPTALLPYCPTALLLPYCPTALLPYCPTALLPYCHHCCHTTPPAS
jgi:hypothetical protein